MIILINWCKIQYLNLDKTLISKKPGHFLEKLKTLIAATTIEFNVFLMKFCTHFCLTYVYKMVFLIFKKILFQFLSVFRNLVFFILASSKQNKKVPNTLLQILVSMKHVQYFNKNSCYLVVVARQNFQFFRENTWFLKNNGASSKFLLRILYNLISITKL